MEQEKDKALGGYTLIPDSISSIPATELSMIEKVLLCKVISLSKGRPCEMSNAAFASCFGISTRQVTEHIKALKAKTWIDVTGPRTKRYIKPTEKALYLWKKPSIEENLYRRNHLEKKPSRTIEGSLSNYRGFLLPKNIENIESIDISANQDLRKCAPSQKRKAERKKFVPPSLDEVEQYVEEKGLAIDARRFFDFYTEGEWHDSGGKPVKNWKQKALTWDRRERKDRESKPPAQGPGRLTQADVDRMEQERKEQEARDEAEYLSRMKQQEGESGS